MKERERKGEKRKKTKEEKVQPEPDDDGKVRESRADGVVEAYLYLYSCQGEQLHYP